MNTDYCYACRNHLENLQGHEVDLGCETPIKERVEAFALSAYDELYPHGEHRAAVIKQVWLRYQKEDVDDDDDKTMEIVIPEVSIEYSAEVREKT